MSCFLYKDHRGLKADLNQIFTKGWFLTMYGDSGCHVGDMLPHWGVSDDLGRQNGNKQGIIGLRMRLTAT